MEYVNGEDVTNNEHLAEAINMTREGSAPPGSTGYDDGEEPTLRDSAFFVAIEELNKIDSAPGESQEEINKVTRMLENARHEDNERRAKVMAEAHRILQDVWVPPE